MTGSPVETILPVSTATDLDGGGRAMERTLTTNVEEGRGAEERRRVNRWRIDQLVRLGVSSVLAETFADVVDWHQIARLVERGCPPDLALEIAS
jgi:hypothetical protein